MNRPSRLQSPLAALVKGTNLLETRTRRQTPMAAVHTWPKMAAQQPMRRAWRTVLVGRPAYPPCTPRASAQAEGPKAPKLRWTCV